MNGPLRTLRGKLLLLALIVEAVMLFFLISNSLRLLRDNMGEQAQRSAEQIVPVLQAALVAPLAQSDFATVQAILDESRTAGSISYLAVIDADGTLVASTGLPSRQELPVPDAGFVLDEREQPPRYDVMRPIELAGQRLGTLHFGLDLTQIIEARNLLLSQGFLIALGELLLSAGMLALLGRLITRQLSLLTRASVQVASGNMTPSAVPEGDDDIGRLGAAFNAMSRAVADRVKQLTVARETAETASLVKNQFLATMSHEIRTPLNGVVGMIGLMLDGELPPQQRHYAKVIANSSQSLLTIINDILDFSKIEAGKLELDHVDFDLHQLIGELASLYSIRAEEKSLLFQHGIDASVPEWINGDPTRLRQILNNFLGNALKFTSEGGVMLSIRQEAATETGVTLRFAIADTGIGIPPELQARLFSAFTQADSSTARQFGGTGLGLAICKQLADLMGGQVGVSANTPAGAVFWATLPFGLASAPVVAAKATGPTAGRQDLSHHTLLLVEDNPINQLVARGILRKLGFHNVVVAGNGVEALEQFEQDRFSLILMDCQMPVMDGYVTTENLRAKGCTLPIIAMTANVLKGEKERCLAVGMNDYISKPIAVDVLARALDYWLFTSAANQPDPAP